MIKRADGRWRESIYINGKRFYFYGASKSEVLRKISAFKAESSAPKLFGKVCDEFWQKHQETLAENSKKGYISNIRRAKKQFGSERLESIQPTHIAAFLEQLNSRYSAKTLSMQLMVINLVYQYAVAHGYCNYNPAREIKAPSGKGKRKRSVPSSDVISAVKASTQCTFGMFALWAMYTGMRRGELLALTWNDINIPERTIIVNKNVYYTSNIPHIKPPKTESGIRVVPLLDALLDRIEPKRSGLIFPDPQTGDPMTYKHFESLWRKYLTESGIPKTATPHTFRHLFATMLFEQGIPAEQAQIILGHAQVSTTMDVYREIRFDMQKRMGRKLLQADIV